SGTAWEARATPCLPCRGARPRSRGPCRPWRRGACIAPARAARGARAASSCRRAVSSQMTSGASDPIFMNFFSRSSRPTGPALRAPELSAILTIDSCWITVRVSSAGPLEDFDHAPALGLGQRPRLHDAHRIPRLGALVVVGRYLLGAHHLFAVEAVREAAHQRNGDRLRHLVAHHDPRAHLAPPPPLLRHAPFLSRRIVLLRAISRRMARNWSGLAIASVPRRNASRKRSSANTASFCSRSSVLSSRNCPAFCRFAILAPLPP